MKENEILEDIHQFRAEHARECGFDLHEIFTQIREGTEHLKAAGQNVVTPAPRKQEKTLAMREEPPKKPKNERQ